MTAVTASAGPSAGRRLGRIGLVVLAALLLVAVTAPWLAPYDPSARVGMPFSSPSARHWLGTDDVGHDILSRLLVGARISLLVGIVAAAVSTVVGATLGLAAGTARGAVDAVVMRTVDVVLSLPFLPLMIVVGVFLGPGVSTQILVIAAVMWAGAARELRAQVLSVREREHVLAARVLGAGTGWILSRHVAPAVAPLVVPQFVLAAKRAILFEAALSFLGLGAAGVPSWGTMLFNAHARSAFLTDAWLWWVVPPGLAIAVTVLAFTLIGYGVEERARPTLRARGRGRTVGSAPATPAPGPPGRLLDIRGLHVVHDTADGAVTTLAAVDLHVDGGETVGLVGASGAGKTTVALAAAGLLRPPARIVGGTVRFAGDDLASLSGEQLRRMRGDRIAYLPQNAGNALNPVFTVADQIAEAIELHRDLSRAETSDRVHGLLAAVGVPGRFADAYPHELSGGTRRRAVLAMALANDPELLIADEPTTGVDVVMRAEIAALLERLRDERGLALLVVSHDLDLVERLADRVVTMDAGRIIRPGTADRTTPRPRPSVR